MLVAHLRNKLLFTLTAFILLYSPEVNAQADSLQLNLQQTRPDNDSWWQGFNDSMLDTIIRKAIANNYDLANAVKNIELAKSRVRISKSAYYPGITASTSYTPEKSSTGIDHIDEYSNVGQVGLSMNWEIDVFGSIRKNVKSQKQYYLASQEDYRGTMVSLTAEIAIAYIQLRAYQQQLEVARYNLQSQEQILRLNESQLQAGLISRLTVAQAKGLWLQTKATIPGIEAAIYSQVNTISVLAGEFSGSLRDNMLQISPLPTNTGIIVAGIPADLIRRRPDIRGAERTMDALAAAAGASRADWWPKFYVTGSFGYGSDYFKQIFKKENMAWKISPAIQWTIFSGRQLVESARTAQLKLEQGINNYNNTLLTALQEVDDAMMFYNRSLQQLDANRQALEQIRLTLDYAMDLYKKGLVDYQNVLDSQRNVLSYENTLVTSQSSALIYMIQLYKALGGGWDNIKNTK